MKLIYNDATDEQVRWGDCSDPRGVLVKGTAYEVEDQSVHSWHTKIKLVGIEGWFNSTCFINSIIDYGFSVGDVVCHVKDPSTRGVVFDIDEAHDLGGVTTCRVAWDVMNLEEALQLPKADTDIQWTNKLSRVESD